MSELPKGWVESSLIDLAKFIDYRGRTPKKTEEGIPLITAKNIKDGFINREPREFIAEADYDGWMTRGIPKVGDVLLTTEAPLGNVAQIDIEEKFALAQRAICFQFYESEVERFIYYYLRSPLFNQELGLNSTGSTVKGIKAATLKKLPVHIAPLAEQKRIVEKLDEVLAQVDTIKARLDGIPALLKRFRQSVLASAVSGKLTEEWRGGAKFDVIESMLVELAKFIDYRGKTPKKTDSGVPLITAKNIKPGYISRTPEEFIAEDDYDGWMTRGFPKVGDILMTTEAPLGNVALIDIEEKFALAQRAICLQFTDERVKSEYACIYMRSMSFQEALLSNATGSTVKGIKASLLKKIVISYPEKEEQKEIVRLVDQYFAFADTIEAQVKKAQARVDNLTQSILAKAFRGELVEQDPNDEPADKLLERIAQARKEAEALAKAAKKAQSTKSTVKKKVAKSA
ncbi:TPA: type I restriction endonuclease subunit S [Vibrio parahaemolyticus]|nr:restriction endonuclease subunit S [Vibrio parahaemolyticus]HAS6904634.1 type I restriction endonuclease subunit S [Vibrio parahaemolyticus]